jgi:pimeloyl-ACP methyl ester carboxylesterase
MSPSTAVVLAIALVWSPALSPRAPAGVTLDVRGRGPDVVLVHGALGDYRVWSPIADSLASSYRVIAVSRRFHWPGAVPTSGVAYSFEGHADDLVVLLRSLGRPAHLVGHSYGAGVALLAALREPDRTLSLTLIEPPFSSLVDVDTPGFASELKSRDSMVAALRASAEAGAHERAAAILMDWVQAGSGDFRSLPRSAQEVIRANAATAGPTYSAPAPRIRCADLVALRKPVLVIRGERTRPWYRFIADATSRCLPQAEHAVLAGADHMTVVENPSGIVELVAPFLARHGSIETDGRKIDGSP